MSDGSSVDGWSGWNVCLSNGKSYVLEQAEDFSDVSAYFQGKKCEETCTFQTAEDIILKV